MNNKYKFKGKSLYDNKWCCGFYANDGIIKVSDCEVIDVDKNTVRQIVGIEINGSDLYEGDVIECKCTEEFLDRGSNCARKSKEVGATTILLYVARTDFLEVKIKVRMKKGDRFITYGEIHDREDDEIWHTTGDLLFLRYMIEADTEPKIIGNDVDNPELLEGLD